MDHDVSCRVNRRRACFLELSSRQVRSFDLYIQTNQDMETLPDLSMIKHSLNRPLPEGVR